MGGGGGPATGCKIPKGGKGPVEQCHGQSKGCCILLPATGKIYYSTMK
ncbi:hypothetical protein ACT7DF_01940 [Bacillus cereus]